MSTYYLGEKIDHSSLFVYHLNHIFCLFSLSYISYICIISIYVLIESMYFIEQKIKIINYDFFVYFPFIHFHIKVNFWEAGESMKHELYWICR